MRLVGELLPHRLDGFGLEKRVVGPLEGDVAAGDVLHGLSALVLGRQVDVDVAEVGGHLAHAEQGREGQEDVAPGVHHAHHRLREDRPRGLLVQPGEVNGVRLE